MNQAYYPPGKYFFSVSVLPSNTATVAATGIDSSFQEVSGIEAETGVEEVAEGGENRFTYRLPKQTKYPLLVLKRGVVTQNSALGEWVTATIGATLAQPIMLQNLMVLLLGEGGHPLISWTFYNAYPLKWKTADLNSMENQVLTESLEFSYSYFVRTQPG
jgi:phage tail-like protein